MLVQISRLILSFLFLFGAISKLVSMPFFDAMVAELFLGTAYYDQPNAMFWVQWLTRILVAFELLIGIALLQNKGFKKIIIPATLMTLLLFTVHLFYDSLTKENGFVAGNCGCFGNVLPMTNGESIVKNLVGMGLGIFVFMRFNNRSFKPWTAPLFVGVITLFTLSFGVKSYHKNTPQPLEQLSISPVDTTQETTVNTPQIISTGAQVNTPEPDLEIITTPNTNPANSAQEKSSTNLPPATTCDLMAAYVPALETIIKSNDTTLICLFSMTCSHCQEVYRDISSLKISQNLPSLYLINYGTEYEQNYFFTQADDEQPPHTRIEDFGTFKRLLEGKTYPRLLLVCGNKVLHEWDVDTYEKQPFMDYLGIQAVPTKPKKGLELDLNMGESPW